MVPCVRIVGGDLQPRPVCAVIRAPEEGANISLTDCKCRAYLIACCKQGARYSRHGYVWSAVLYGQTLLFNLSYLRSATDPGNTYQDTIEGVTLHPGEGGFLPTKEAGELPSSDMTLIRTRACLRRITARHPPSGIVHGH